MENEAQITINCDAWPIVIVKYVGDPSEDQVLDLFSEVEKSVIGRREPFAMISDFSNGSIPDAIQRNLLAELQSPINDAYAQYCVGEAFVAKDDMRGAFTAILWRVKLPYPHVFVDSLDAAQEWIEERLSEHSSSA